MYSQGSVVERNISSGVQGEVGGGTVKTMASGSTRTLYGVGHPYPNTKISFGKLCTDWLKKRGEGGI